MDHGVDDLRVAQAVSFARLRKKIRSVGHRFHSAGDDDGTVPRLHRLRCESDGFQSGAADFVYCHGTCRGRESAEDRGLSRRILTESSRNDVAHDAFVDLRGIDGGALHCFANDHGAELRRGKITETSLEFSDRDAATGDDDGIVESRHKMRLLRGFAGFIIDAAGEDCSGSRWHIHACHCAKNSNRAAQNFRSPPVQEHSTLYLRVITEQHSRKILVDFCQRNSCAMTLVSLPT